ncbi:MAG: GTPase Era [Rhodothermales bacterium]
MEPILNLDAVPADHRSGYVALIGKPNVGKSTLLNALLGSKLSIVTPKAQTTRHRILGIFSDDEAQIIFLDTPGIIKPRYQLQEAMMHNVRDAITDADLIVFLADARQDAPDTLSLDQLGTRPAILAINKIDLIQQEDALPLVERYTTLRAFEEIIPISALTGFNLDVLMREIRQRLPLGPPFYPKDMISEHPQRFFVAEIIREKVFQKYRQEIPYSAAVNITAYEERSDGKDLIDAEIVVERDSQKGILIGKGGRALKQVGIAARKDIEAFLGKPVFLKLFVKVRSDWRNKDTFLRSYGYR